MGIPTVGKALCADRIGGITAAAPADYLELGDGNTAFAAGDTALDSAITGNGLARAQDATPAADTTTTTEDTLVLSYEWTASGSETIREVGSFNAAAAGTMLHREVLSTARSMTSGSTYTYTLSLVVA
jgi:hypothetical protein